jgi:F-type H+-transporting ATPase subunit epsilon
MLHLLIQTPQKTLFDDTVESVYVPSSEGEMGVLEDHEPLVARLVPGVIEVTKSSGDIVTLAVGSGVITVMENSEVLILSEELFESQELDEKTILEAKERLEKEIENQSVISQEELSLLQNSLLKELAKLEIKRK